jgi:chemotaxis protein histidine kinase CheA/ActR/RegA family two-component response regulator
MAQHDRILGYFLDEAKDHLNTIEQGLRKLPETVKQPATIRELFRAAHSIKGSAAMLGLLDVQQVGNQFEANFKLLKEQPTIAVDHKLQNLFLESFNFLRAAVDEVAASSDPYRRDPHSPDPVGDPVFEELKSYLQQLLSQVDPAGITPIAEQSFSQDPAVEQVFGEYVTRKLGEISSLCLQADQPETRAQIQQICQKLGGLGDNFEFLEWTNLFTACRLAIANPHNNLHQLGESIGIAVKQAQILILSDRHQAINVTPDLEALIETSTLENHQNGAAPQTEAPATSMISPGLSSIYDRVQPLQFDGDDLADLSAVPAAAADSGSIELDEFMNLLGDDIPADGTWMQDDEFANSDEFSLEDLADSNEDSLSATRSGQFYEQIFEPSPQPPATVAKSSEPTTQPMGAIAYDEETFFTPEFGDLDDPDIATFWSDEELVGGQMSLDGIADLDRSASGGLPRFQPEQPLDRDFHSPLPDFTLDDRAMSDLFPTPTATGDWREADLPPVNQTAAEDFTGYSSGFGEIDPIADNDFSANLQSQSARNGLDPLASIGTMDTYEQSLSTHEQDLSTHDLPTPEPDLDVLASAESAQDFTDLDLSDSIELEQVGEIDRQLDDDASEWNDLIRDMDIDETDDGEALFAIDLAEESVLDPIPSIDPVTAENHAANLASSLHGQDIYHATDIATESMSGSLLFEDFDSSELPDLQLSEAGANELTGWIDSYADPHEIDDFAGLDLDEIDLESIGDDAINQAPNHLELDLLNHPEPIVNPTTDQDLTDLNLNELSDLEPVADLAGSGDIADLNSADFNNAEIDLDLAVSDDIADLNLDDLNNAEPVTDLSIGNEFADLDLDSFGEMEPVADLSIGNDFADLNLDNLNQAEPVDSLAISNEFADLDLDSFGEMEPVADRSIGNDFADLNLDNLNQAEPVDSLAISNEFADLDLDSFGEMEPVADRSIDNDFADLNLDDLNQAEPVDSLAISNEFADLDLDSFGEMEPVADRSIDNDFADLNLADYNDIDPVSDLSVNDNFTDLNLDELSIPDSTASDDFANLDFNLNQTSDNLSLDELTDLGSILDASPEANGMGDLDALLLGTAAVGIGGAVMAGASTFDDLDALMGTPAPTAITNPTVVQPTTTEAKVDRRSKQRTFEQTMRVSVRHLDNLNNLVGELVVSRNTLEQDQNRMRQFIEKLLSEVQKLNEVGKRMQDLYERSLMENSLIASRQQSRPQIPQSQSSGELGDQTGALMEYDPLEMDRFTPIHLLSQKMIELTVRVRESTADIEFVVDGSTEVTRTLRQITGQLQEDLTKSRMIPFAQTADRLQRGVRDNGLKYGKQVELEIEGRDTLIDKVILESLSDPLIHMVNNAIAHGIESPETRQAAGKPAQGSISVRALHQGNQTIISISDDGAGINTEIVKAKAIEKGIITNQQALTMTKPEVYELLFLPSFSTKDQADELAGRGVGMDVVRTSLTEIRGTITTESQLGIGTTFTIRLPLALSIAKALIAVNNKTNIAFPMDGIEDTQDVSPEQIQTNSNGEQCIFWRDNLMPFKPLSDLLGFNRPLPRNNFYGTQEDDSDLVSILILRSDGNLTAVQVDKIIGDQEIAIKPLQGPASKPLGVAGATVLGDGRIIPIADVMELVDLASGKLIRHVSAQWTTQMSAPTSTQRESMVLIVDDSITVRELLSLTFKRAGYRVEQARDGQEAWDKLRAGLPCDIVFCDIEMPRMDGLEFLSRIQKDAALSKVPVAMLTSRGSDRHRQIASQLGASGYFIKPYLEEALLDAAKRMIKGEVLAIV